MCLILNVMYSMQEGDINFSKSLLIFVMLFSWIFHLINFIAYKSVAYKSDAYKSVAYKSDAYTSVAEDETLLVSLYTLIGHNAAWYASQGCHKDGTITDILEKVSSNGRQPEAFLCENDAHTHACTPPSQHNFGTKLHSKLCAKTYNTNHARFSFRQSQN